MMRRNNYQRSSKKHLNKMMNQNKLNQHPAGKHQLRNLRLNLNHLLNKNLNRLQRQHQAQLGNKSSQSQLRNNQRGVQPRNQRSMHHHLSKKYSRWKWIKRNQKKKRSNLLNKLNQRKQNSQLNKKRRRLNLLRKRKRSKSQLRKKGNQIVQPEANQLREMKRLQLKKNLKLLRKLFHLSMLHLRSKNKLKQRLNHLNNKRSPYLNK